MPVRKPARAGAAVLSLVILGGMTGPASAQLMSKWGHPVFTLGWTPYDSINVGHGNFPGGPGFIPGYGYYPGRGPDHYPWMDGPGTPFDRRKLAPAFPGDGGGPGPEEAPLPPGTALLIVKLPAEAELSFDGAPTLQGGSYRRFLTPPLPAGRSLTYTLRARWRIRDAELTRVEEVAVAPGGVFTINFLTVDSWTGRRLPAAPAAGSDPEPLP